MSVEQTCAMDSRRCIQHHVNCEVFGSMEGTDSQDIKGTPKPN